MEDKVTVPPKRDWKQMGHEEATVAVHEEMKRVQRFPSNSTYATHRLRVLNKILQLLSIQNCISGRGTGVAVFWAFFVLSCVNGWYSLTSLYKYNFRMKGS